MKLALEEKPEGKPIVVITANGKTDLKILEALANRHNHQTDKTLYIPQRTYTHLGGLKPSIEALTTILHHQPITDTYIILIDKEHIKNPNQIPQQLQAHGITPTNTQQKQNLIKTEATHGTKQITIYTAILGKNKRIEENIAHLIKLEYDEQIEPDKKAIKTWLKQKDLTLHDLITQARKANLEKALPQLTKLLKELTTQKP